MKRMQVWFFVILFAGFRIDLLNAQNLSVEEISDLVQLFKNDSRGPFQGIRWFCPDGSMVAPPQRCSQPGGIQHALPKTAVQELADLQGIYLAQILAGTSNDDFWDAAHDHSRAKQYILEKFLFEADDGWILRKAQYYRGAYQVEDEEAWGLQFFQWLLKKDAPIREQFFLIRQLVNAVPHRAQNDHLLRLRAISKEIADADTRFMDIRTKIHGQPESSDLQLVKDFMSRYQSSINPGIQAKLIQLQQVMESFYQETRVEHLRTYLSGLSENSICTDKLNRLLESAGSFTPRELCISVSEFLWTLRQQLVIEQQALRKLTLLDLSIDLESVLFRNVADWRTLTGTDLIEKVWVLCEAAAACGFLEIWEWEAIAPFLAKSGKQPFIPLPLFTEKSAAFRRLLEWCTGMVYAIMEPAVRVYGFEPLAAGFFDHCLRSSIILPLGEAVAILSDMTASQTGSRNQVMNIQDNGGMQGLNPGFCVGILTVIPSSPEHVEFNPQQVYALSRVPSNLAPVAGILTVSGGNLVSHVQLLARNLGIPNAVINASHLQALLPFQGTPVFYAVSPGGAIVMKPEAKMTAEEKQLVEIQSRREEKIRVSVDKLRLNQINLIPLSQVKSTDSGQLCGPKAANLGELKQVFPDHVVNGIVIPFGVFDLHLDQMVPGRNITYWQMLQTIYREAERDRQSGLDEAAVEKQLLDRLKTYREWLKIMPFEAEFIAELSQFFITQFGRELGKVPVFIRSDTNMEDLKDFTGAGLNLTVFNVVEKEKILQAIRDVWMSPFTERSYRWRQKYLLNPESVYPSILIMPTVNVDKSGVMITSGVPSGASTDISVAFNRGVAGSVEGQISEQVLLKNNGEDMLISPAREPEFTTVPASGGTMKKRTAFNERILTDSDRRQLRQIADFIRQRMKQVSGTESQGPYDVELGFQNDQLFLFQVRPFVENKMARSTAYLQHLDPPLQESKLIRLDIPYRDLIE
jgi:hypothetical protein